MEWNTRVSTIRKMQIFGGSFVKALATAWQHADQDNALKIEAAFPEYIEKYRTMGGGDNGGEAA